MAKDKYEMMKYDELKSIYAKRCGYMGIENPSIPKRKKDLITMLRVADSFGVPQDENTDPMDSIRNAFVGILEKGIEESKRRGSQEPAIYIRW